MTIPKNIYMCYKDLDILKKYSKNWEKLNPDWNILLYDDDLCKEFLLKEYSQIYVDIFNFIVDGPIKSDFWRLCILNKYGGLYVDADINPIIPLDNYINEDDYFVTCISQNFKNSSSWSKLNPHFIYCNKNNDILQSCISRYISLYSDKIPYSYWTWSICNYFIIPNINNTQYIQYINNNKYKFIIEKDNGVRELRHCVYNNDIVLYNSYSNYKNHKFVE